MLWRQSGRRAAAAFDLPSHLCSPIISEIS
jgi:hypothetical protein